MKRIVVKNAHACTNGVPLFGDPCELCREHAAAEVERVLTDPEEMLRRVTSEALLADDYETLAGLGAVIAEQLGTLVLRVAVSYKEPIKAIVVEALFGPVWYSIVLAASKAGRR